VVEQSTHDPKFVGSNPPVSGRGRESIVRKRGSSCSQDDRELGSLMGGLKRLGI
jgi:hypothetical protein